MTFKTSSPQRPCRVCGRKVDGDCRWKEGLILCHQGRRHRPPDFLQPGDVLEVDGQPWLLLRRNGGFDGASAVFVPFKGKPKRTTLPSAAERAGIACETLVIQRAVTAWLAEVDQALAVIPFEDSPPNELHASFELIEATYAHGQALRKLVARLRSQDTTVKNWGPVLREAHKAIDYQRRDMRHYRTHHLGEELGADG